MEWFTPEEVINRATLAALVSNGWLDKCMDGMGIIYCNMTNLIIFFKLKLIKKLLQVLIEVYY